MCQEFQDNITVFAEWYGLNCSDMMTIQLYLSTHSSPILVRSVLPYLTGTRNALLY